MDIIKKLTSEFSRQEFAQSKKAVYAEELDRYKRIARGYAEIENAIVVLSDMHASTSYMYYGSFSDILGLKHSDTEEDQIGSIWEEKILQLINPDDLYNKYLQELRFFHFIKHQPKGRRRHYYLMNILRMKDAIGNYHAVCHRLFYIPEPYGNSMWLALCLYNPLVIDVSNNSMVVNSVTGEMQELETKNDSNILSDREKQVLRLIDKGLMSKHIAERLSISINTVSRHRQEILSKLQVKNSIEACRVAKDLGLI